MQLLTYALVVKLQIFVAHMNQFVRLLIDISVDSFELRSWGFEGIFALSYVLNGVILGFLISFYRFHVQLINDNMTTIEYLDKMRGSQARHEVLDFNMGFYHNFI
mmetsp:Transcript_20690/g.18106  ORF Transcript_20690/g.18106 Transcript_20690/m.18106 type:complete len:105 (-) Transcript_20690:714-1028(-)